MRDLTPRISPMLIAKLNVERAKQLKMEAANLRVNAWCALVEARAAADAAARRRRAQR